MAIEVELPREIELWMMANKELDVLMSRRIARDILETIKDDTFVSIILTLCLKSDISEDDADELDHKMKREIMEKLGWR